MTIFVGDHLRGFPVLYVLRSQVNVVVSMDLIHVAAILARDKRFCTPSLELKSLETSFGAQKENFSTPVLKMTAV